MEKSIVLPDHFDIPIGKGTSPRTMRINLEGLTDDVIAGALFNGFKQAANDAHSTVTEEEVPDKADRAKQALAAAEKRRDEAWYKGMWARAGGGNRGPSDPMLKEMRTLARVSFSLTAKVAAGLDRDAIMEHCRSKAVMLLAREADVDPKAIKAKDRDEKAAELYGRIESKAAEIIEQRDFSLED